MNQLNGKDCRELIFKHFPAELTGKECCDFLKGIGAISSRMLNLCDSRQRVSYFIKFYCLRSPQYVVAEFPNAEYAWAVIRDLHQRPIVDKRISVEFYEPKIADQKWEPLSVEADTESRSIRSSPNVAIMAPKWDSSFPVPPNLIYRYPSATNAILTNIVRCMISCPSFYTQVCLLLA